MKKLFLSYALLTFCTLATAEKQSSEIGYIQKIKKISSISDEILKNLYQLAKALKPNNTLPLLAKNNSNIPLFQGYPYLKKSIMHVSLACLPTPINNLEKLNNLYESKGIYIKCDNLAGKALTNGTKLFGGNKVRKLEFLLADALQHNAKTILTYGGFGSNHGVCTATYAHHLGFKTILLLKPQPNCQVVRRNLLLMNIYSNQFYICENPKMRALQSAQAFLDNKKTFGDFPYIIPVGGSNIYGITGFVNAAFELKAQIDAGSMPEPDVIYVALGTGGTAIGLQLGLFALGMKTKIVAVTTEPEDSHELITKLKSKFERTNKFLSDHDSTFARYPFEENTIEIRYEFCGQKYGLFTKEGAKSKKLLKEVEGIELDGTYTAKAFSCLMSDLKKGRHKNNIVLFWNTFCSDDFSILLKKSSYKQLPAVFHKYFESSVQLLDH